MIHIVLHEPEIPQNTGNIARTCTCVDATLHLIEPMGFRLDEKRIRRAGLDYWEHLRLEQHSSLDAFLAAHPRAADSWLLFTTHGISFYDRHEPFDQDGDCYLVFGKETAGLPQELRAQYPDGCVRIPMVPDRRSLNLSNAVAIAAYWAWQKLDFSGSL